jgi:hypothetical protein
MKPRRFHPIVSLLMATVLIGLGASCGYFAYEGQRTGRVTIPSKHSPMREASREDSPSAFSYSIIFYAGTSLIMTGLGLFQVREARLWFLERKQNENGA